MAHPSGHEVVAVAMRVRGARLETLVERVSRLPDERLEAALARAVDVESLAHVEQLETRILGTGELATAYLGLARVGEGPSGRWRPLDARRDADERHLVAVAGARLRAKLSYTNLGFALASEVFTMSELRDVYVAALGYDVSATNLQRVLIRRGAIVRADGRRAPGRSGGRPAALFRFASQKLEVTDEFAALRPPTH